MPTIIDCRVSADSCALLCNEIHSKKKVGRRNKRPQPIIFAYPSHSNLTALLTQCVNTWREWRGSYSWTDAGATFSQAVAHFDHEVTRWLKHALYPGAAVITALYFRVCCGVRRVQTLIL
jgi:hypothetical protein